MLIDIEPLDIGMIVNHSLIPHFTTRMNLFWID